MTDSAEGPSTKSIRPQEPAAPEQRARRGLIAALSGLTALAVLSVLLCAACGQPSTASGGAHPTPRPSTSTPTPALSITWQRYIDPDGHFTISIPRGWMVWREPSTLEVGNPPGNIIFHNMNYYLGGPPNGQNTITIYIWVEPIETDRARQYMCGGFPPDNARLAGLPAIDDNDSWMLTSSGAHFQIDYVYPNDPGDRLNIPTPTPMPPGFYEKGQEEWHAILASFMPTPDTPLKCS
jgi:hypothetical protein